MTKKRTRNVQKRRSKDPRPSPPSETEAGTSQEAPTETAYRTWLAAMFLLALLLRLAVLNRLMGLPIHRTPELDSLEFLLRAGRFQHGDFLPPVVPQHGPGYPAFIAIVFLAFPGSILALGVVQCVLGAALCVMVASLGRRWFGPRVGMAAGVLLAVNGPLILLSGLILAEGLLLFLLFLSLVCYDVPSLSWPRMLAAGGLLGLATAVRPTAVLILPFLAAIAVRRHGSRGWLAAGILGSAFLIALSPVVVTNARAGRGLFVIQGNAGLSFYLGNSPSGTGSASARLGGSWDSIAGEAARRGIATSSEQDRYYVRRTLTEIRANPSAYVRLLARKTLTMLQASEVRDSHAFDFFALQIPLLRWLPGFGLLLSLGTCGLLLTLRRRRAPLLAAGYLLVFGASCLFLVVGFRYRSPIVPMLAVFAGLGAVTLFESYRNRSVRSAAALSAVFATVWALSHAFRSPDDHRLAEEWSFTGSALIREGDLVGAESAYRIALAENAHFAPAWTGIGTVSLNRSDLPSATREFRRAIADEPGYARAHYLLGSASEQQGDPAAAALEFEAARNLRPDDPDSLRALARVLARMGRWAEAERVGRSFVRLYPDDAAGHLDLARVETALHRVPTALVEATRSTLLDPTKADAWLLRGVLAVDTRNSTDARIALQEAEALAGPDQPPIEFARALLERLQSQPDAAEARLRRLLSRHPDFSEAGVLLLEIATQNGHRQSAETFLSAIAKRRDGKPSP